MFTLYAGSTVHKCIQAKLLQHYFNFDGWGKGYSREMDAKNDLNQLESCLQMYTIFHWLTYACVVECNVGKGYHHFI